MEEIKQWTQTTLLTLFALFLGGLCKSIVGEDHAHIAWDIASMRDAHM
jgi:hypothetical protein